MSEQDNSDKILEEIRSRRGGGFKMFKVRISVPFYLDVLVCAQSPERALKQIQWELMPEDRERLLNNAEWKHVFGKQFDNCSGPVVLDRYRDDIPALEDLLSPFGECND